MGFDGIARDSRISMVAVLILFGMILTRVFSDEGKADLIDFTHLTERAMLYVVFTFGEMIIAMNNITTSLEFMRDEAVQLMPKTLFLLGSFLMYFICLFALQRFARPELRLCRRFLLPIAGTAFVFAGLMILARENMQLNIALSVAYVFFVFLRIRRYSGQNPPCRNPEEEF